MFDTYLRLWDLMPDGGPILTGSGGVLPVAWRARPAMLNEARRSNALMTWWNGNGAARVCLHDSDAVLFERAQPAPTLAGLSAIWLMEDEQPPDTRPQVAALAATALDV